MFVKLKRKRNIRRAKVWVRQSLVHGYTFTPSDLLERFNVSESDLNVLSVRSGALWRSNNRLEYTNGVYRPYGDFVGKVVFPVGDGKDENVFVSNNPLKDESALLPSNAHDVQGMAKRLEAWPERKHMPWPEPPPSRRPNHTA